VYKVNTFDIDRISASHTTKQVHPHVCYHCQQQCLTVLLIQSLHCQFFLQSLLTNTILKDDKGQISLFICSSYCIWSFIFHSKYMNCKGIKHQHSHKLHICYLFLSSHKTVIRHANMQHAFSCMSVFPSKI
jgi:hypothetical protein